MNQQRQKVLIVGGVAGGASAAARLRRLDEHAEIIMFEKGPHISFANCGLPYYIGGSITDRERLLVQTPKGMADRFQIDVRTQSEVIAIHPDTHTIQIQHPERGLYEESYDKLILSPGARPFIPNLPGNDHPLIFTVRNVPDIERIKERVTSEDTRSAIVIGGGFIGVEMAENLREAGLHVTLVESNPQLLAPFDPELATALAQEMEQHGVKLMFKQRVIGFHSYEQSIRVELESGSPLSADLVILAIGVRPDTSFLQSSGIALGSRGHIVVNESLETNLPDIYAVGDAIEVKDYIHGSQTTIPLAGPANKQGRIVADRIAGLNSSYKGTMGTSVIKVFDLTGASTGSSEKKLKRLGIDYQSVIVHPSSHASYYPGASAITLKLLFTPTGKILGAQAIGYEGVDKRIDDIATAIHFGGSIHDLAELELSYAPPYSSAKDPVNMAGYAAENIVSGRVQVFTYDQLTERDSKQSILLDVRSELEHQNGHIPGSLSIPVDELRQRLNELDRSKEIWVYCQVGLRGYTASQMLRQYGFETKNLSGGYKTYRMAQFQTSSFSSEESNNNNRQPNPLPTLTVVENGSHITEHPTAQPMHIDVELDVRGLSCPGPLMEVKKTMDQLPDGQTLHVQASDPGFYEDIKAWTTMSKSTLLKLERGSSGMIEAIIGKTIAEQNLELSPSISTEADPASTMVVFSGDLDKAIASLIIANGAAASGRKVTMFFTFWGLTIIRKQSPQPISKTIIGRMFDMMLPRTSHKLRLSQMNMFGAGPKMIRGLMKHHNVPSLEELIQSAVDQGVEMVACQMSMDLMNIHRDELMDHVKSVGVGYYLGQASQANHNLFV